MLQDQKEVLLEDPSMYDELDKALHLLFLRRWEHQYSSWPILTAKAKILYEKLYGNSDSSVTDTSDTCMRWMEQQEEATPQEVMLLQKLKMMLPERDLQV